MPFALPVVIDRISSSALQGGSFCSRLRAVSWPGPQHLHEGAWHLTHSPDVHTSLGSQGVQVDSHLKLTEQFSSPLAAGAARGPPAACESKPLCAPAAGSSLFTKPSGNNWVTPGCVSRLPASELPLSISLPSPPSPGFPCPAHAQHRRAAEAHGGRRPRRTPAAVPGAQPCRRVPLPAETQALGVFLGEESRGAHDPEHPAEREYVTGEAERSHSPARRRWDGRSGGNVFPLPRSQEVFGCCSLEQDCCL